MGFNSIICLVNSLPIEPPAPVIQIIDPSTSFFSKWGYGSTASLSSKSSILIGFKESIIDFLLVISAMDGIEDVLRLYFCSESNICFLLLIRREGMAIKTWSISFLFSFRELGG